MAMGAPVDRRQIAMFKSAANGFHGEIAQEKIVIAVLQHPAFRGKEITVWDVTGTQVYFRLGIGGKHIPNGADAVHVHLPYEPFDKTLGRPSSTTRAGSSKNLDQIVALVGDPKRPGSVHDYVSLLLKALEQGRYEAAMVKD